VAILYALETQVITMSNDIHTWFENHSQDYAAVESRLQSVKYDLLYGDIHKAADMLEKSYMFAVLSIKTERDRHERAFTAHYAGDLSRKEAALETVYGGNKKNWIRRTFDAVQWTDLVWAVRTHYKYNRIETLLETVVDNLTGVSYRKASFMLAMLGLTEYACVDSNVANYADRDIETEFYSAESYMAACDDIFADILGGQDRFVKQWAVYDMERGEHARHNAFYAEL
jgi:hypothetical protein